MSRIALVLSACACLALLGCSSDDLVAPSPPAVLALEGDWTLTMSDQWGPVTLRADGSDLVGEGCLTLGLNNFRLLTSVRLTFVADHVVGGEITTLDGWPPESAMDCEAERNTEFEAVERSVLHVFVLEDGDRITGEWRRLGTGLDGFFELSR